MNEHISSIVAADRDIDPGEPADPPGHTDGVAVFRRLLVNTLVANVTNSLATFALAFWIYLETGSVLVASIVSGVSMLAGALCGAAFGAVVDASRKKTAMVASSSVTCAAFAAAGGVSLAVPGEQLGDWRGPWLWAFAGLILLGGVAGQLRSIALSTSVTLLIPADRRDRANGLVGTVNGLAHMTTSVLAGLSVGFLGMGGTAAIAVALTAVALGHLLSIRMDEPRPRPAGRHPLRLDLRGAWRTMRAVPGLVSLVFFSTFNNLVMGVFMTLMDPYGLNLFSVEVWGVVLGVTSIGFMAGGAAVARWGLGRRPLRILLLVNVAIALIGMASGVREWQWLLVVGMFGFMLVIPVGEAAEQTILQRVVPFEKQGRVFGFAQSVESASTPVAAFVVGPAAQFLLIPYMASEPGRAAFGWLLGEGQARGLALTFVLASLVMLIVVLLAFRSRAYRALGRRYASRRQRRGAEPISRLTCTYGVTGGAGAQSRAAISIRARSAGDTRQASATFPRLKRSPMGEVSRAVRSISYGLPARGVTRSRNHQM
ncbi:MAG TPA: MFS transporter [Nonomuraea sp.]|nr:MFS transporter [Nonomuraea sp.]